MARLGEGEDDLNLKDPSPPPFIKVLNSRRVIFSHFTIIAKSDSAWSTANRFFNI